MKKIFYLLLTLPFLITSCSNDDSDADEHENIGTVEGTWAFASISADVETSGSSLSTVINPLLEVALQTYAGKQEPTYYIFDDEGYFEAYVTSEEDGSGVALTGSGTYILSEESLELAYSETSQTETFEVIVANESTLKLRKDYSNSILYWGADIAGQYAGVTITKAKSTLIYNK
ncbi:hypothetical protein D0T53_08890 [Dysgonomonas sp. 216]|uniref:lipocalin family protein n=1 Tax=Dysgonomonas sp. 216 TaxID=2302934 RepID=UPI0013D4F657|nr:lipocalin family protein [Dysgonomonas sp. 216]NDW19026.1 hypothetical protein [Dysgonomonas sp. 216]